LHRHAFHAGFATLRWQAARLASQIIEMLLQLLHGWPSARHLTAMAVLVRVMPAPCLPPHHRPTPRLASVSLERC